MTTHFPYALAVCSQTGTVLHVENLYGLDTRKLTPTELATLENGSDSEIARLGFTQGVPLIDHYELLDEDA